MVHITMCPHMAHHLHISSRVPWRPVLRTNLCHLLNMTGHGIWRSGRAGCAAGGRWKRGVSVSQSPPELFYPPNKARSYLTNTIDQMWRCITKCSTVTGARNDDECFSACSVGRPRATWPATPEIRLGQRGTERPPTDPTRNQRSPNFRRHVSVTTHTRTHRETGVIGHDSVSRTDAVHVYEE